MVPTVPVDEVNNLERDVFLENYRFKRPVIARGAARHMEAFKKWDIEYLTGKIGNATIQPLVYCGDKRDYSSASFVEMSFSQFCQKLESGNDETLYWFEGPSSANFWGGEDKQARLNEDITSLSKDLSIPSFLKESEVVLAQMIMGTGKNGTLLHHDYGGEAKALAQLRGEKHILLVAPQHAKYLQLNTITSGKNFSISKLKMRESDGEIIGKSIPVYEAHIKPGDILYWPSFWFHDVSNSGQVNLAINMPIDEVPCSPSLVRHMLATFYRQAQDKLESHGHNKEIIADFLRQFVDELEAETLENMDVSTMWSLHVNSKAYQGKHWRNKYQNLQRQQEEAHEETHENA